MSTYVDTSMLVKLLIEEEGSDSAELIWNRAEMLVSARVLYAEARAALAAARRTDRLSSKQHRSAVAEFDILWAQLNIAEISQELVEQAAQLSDVHGLRGYDAIHLAAAILVGATILASADSDLCDAAARHDLHVADPRSAD